MNLAHIELSQLVISPANMRAKKKNRDIADLIPSVRARGVLVPLLVRPNGAPDMYEIVAGRRRYFAAKAVSEETGETIALPCAIMAPGDDAAALEASLIENVARLDPDEVAQWETFARLIREGRSVEDIAAIFDIPEATVRRVLALGNLLPRILTLYRTEQIEAYTVRCLTLATTAQQRAWLSAFESREGHAPTGRALKAWLFGGDAISTSAALFDLAAYTAPIVADLFEEHSYFSDASLFWNLQSKAIEDKKQAYLDDGWVDVTVLTDGRWFDRWAHEKRSKKQGGRVYIAVSEGGAVDIHEGYLPRKEAERRDRAEQQPAAPHRSELTAPLRRYVDLHRHAAVRAALLDRPLVALRLMLAHVMAESPLWSVKAERQNADKAETHQSVAASMAESVFNARRRDCAAKLGYEPEQVPIVGQRPPMPALFRALLKLSDEDILELVPIVMGETLDASGQMIEPLGVLLNVDMAAMWAADEAFWTLVRDRRTLSAFVEEVAGSQAAHANGDAPAKVLKGILRDCLAGEHGRAKVDTWVPRWLRFPSSNYLGGDSTPEASVEVETADDAASSEGAAPESEAVDT